MKKIILLMFCGLLVAACSRDKIDFDLLDDIRLSPGLQLPLVKAHLSLGDLVKEDSLIRVDDDNLISIAYSQDSLFGFSALQFVEIPEQDPTPVPVRVGDPPFDLGIAMGTLAGSELSLAHFETALLRYTINTPTPVTTDVEFTLTIQNATFNGSTFEHVFVLPANSISFDDSLDISGIQFDLSNNGTQINYLAIKMEITDEGAAPIGHDFFNTIQLTNLSLLEANGFFGDKVINIPSGQFDFDISSLNDLSDGFQLANPSIRLITASSMGVGLQFKPDFFGVNGTGTVAGLKASQYQIPKATSSTILDTTVITIDKTNSEIVEFLANLPKLVTYGGQAQMNPAGRDANFISKNARLNIGLEIDIPLEISASNLVIEETINDVQISSSEEVDAIESLSLFFRTTNGFPFDVDLDIAFLDENDAVLETVQIPLLDAASTNASGRVNQSSSSEYDVVFEDNAIKGLLNAKKIRITGRLNTTNNGQTIVKMYTDYELDVQIATQTKVNY